MSTPQISTPVPPLLEVGDLTVTYRNAHGAVQAVRGVSFTLHRGRTLAIVGESGSGKSTVALALGRLLPPYASVTGSVRWEGTDLLALPERTLRTLRGRRLAWLFQEPAAALNPAVSIGGQIEEILRVHRPEWPDRRTRAQQLAADLGLPDPDSRWRDRPGAFSGGQLQRLLLALALAPEPDLLIADEPTSALDVTLQARLFSLLRAARQRLGLTVLLVTHHLALVRGFADDLLVMRDGAVVETGPVETILTAPQHAYTRELLAAVPRLRHAPVVA